MFPFKGWLGRVGAEWVEATRFKLNGTEVTATAAQLNNTVTGARTVVAAGSTKTLTAANAANVINLDTATGSVVTLPAATGTGNVFEFVTTVLATSNSHIVKVANGTDVFAGSLIVVNNAAGDCTAFGTVAADDTITLNRTTTGSVKIGEHFYIKDVKAGFFAVEGIVIGTGTIATPFSATV